MDAAKPFRKIRSFAVRSARMTEAQQHAYEQHMSRWAIKPDATIEVGDIFRNSNPLVLEIGFGMGDSLAEMAATNPNNNYIGVEVHQAGIGRLLNLVEKNQLENIRVVHGDAVDLLEHHFCDDSIERVNIYFPDPWHKRKHHKRRLIQNSFVELLARRMRQAGLLHIATDWQHYAEHVLDVMQSQQQFTNIAGDARYTDARVLGRPETKFERRGIKLGHGVWDLAFRKDR